MDINAVLAASPYIASGFIATILSVFLTGWRYRIMLAKLSARISLLRSTLTVFSSQTASYVAPFRIGAIGTRPVVTNALAGIDMKKSFFVTVFENFLDMSWQILILPFLLILAGEYATLHDLYTEAAVVVVFLSFALVLLKRGDWFFPKAWKLRVIIPQRFRDKMLKKKLTREKLKKMLKESRTFVQDKALMAKILAPTSLMVVTTPLAFWAMGLMMGLQMGYREAFLIYWIAAIVGRLSGMPGGYLTKDLSMVGAMGLLGFDINISVTVTLLHRLVVMVPVIAFGAPTIVHAGGSLFRKRKAFCTP